MVTKVMTVRIAWSFCGVSHARSRSRVVAVDFPVADGHRCRRPHRRTKLGHAAGNVVRGDNRIVIVDGHHAAGKTGGGPAYTMELVDLSFEGQGAGFAGATAALFQAHGAALPAFLQFRPDGVGHADDVIFGDQRWVIVEHHFLNGRVDRDVIDARFPGNGVVDHLQATVVGLGQGCGRLGVGGHKSRVVRCPWLGACVLV